MQGVKLQQYQNKTATSAGMFGTADNGLKETKTLLPKPAGNNMCLSENFIHQNICLIRTSLRNKRKVAECWRRQCPKLISSGRCRMLLLITGTINPVYVTAIVLGESHHGRLYVNVCK